LDPNRSAQFGFVGIRSAVLACCYLLECLTIFVVSCGWRFLIVVEASAVNVVATASLDQSVDFDKLGRLREVLHDPNTYGLLSRREWSLFSLLAR